MEEGVEGGRGRGWGGYGRGGGHGLRVASRVVVQNGGGGREGSGPVGQGVKGQEVALGADGLEEVDEIDEVRHDGDELFSQAGKCFAVAVVDEIDSHETAADFREFPLLGHAGGLVVELWAEGLARREVNRADQSD